MDISVKRDSQQKLLSRLRRVEGQIRGIQGMIESEQDCAAIAQQLAAARKALDRAFFEMIACSMQVEMAAATSPAAAESASAHIADLLAKYG